MNVLDSLISGIWMELKPNLWWIISVAIAIIVLTRPMPGRGPKSSRLDIWRSFKFEVRDVVMKRAGHRCEAPEFIIWGRCSADATEADHVFPWSRGGPTVVSNGQALCTHHNRSKGSINPPWWYILGLERRRRDYFPVGADVRVFAVMNAQEQAARKRQ